MTFLAAVLLLAAPAADWTPKPVKRPDGLPQIQLTLTRCLIHEAEQDPMPYSAESAKECERINRATAATRNPRRMRLRAGKYVFRVSNRDVPWVVDFAIRGERDKALPRAAGGKLGAGQAADYTIDLAPGIYVYSSPLGGTSEYALLVER